MRSQRGFFFELSGFSYQIFHVHGTAVEDRLTEKLVADRGPCLVEVAVEECLIDGLDPSGGAWIIADIKTFTASRCFGTAAVASLTYQNTVGVFGAIHQSGATVREQVQPVIDDLGVDALKMGMLPTLDVIETTAFLVRSNRLKNFVVDPVVRSTSGFDLIGDEALRSLIDNLFPLSDLITPNIPEAERIARMTIRDEADIAAAAEVMRSMGARNILIKGGHFAEQRFRESTAGPVRQATDHLFIGGEPHLISADHIETAGTHGTGCVLAAAITANLALGLGLLEAVTLSKYYVNDAIRLTTGLGKGSSPIGFPLLGLRPGGGAR